MLEHSPNPNNESNERDTNPVGYFEYRLEVFNVFITLFPVIEATCYQFMYGAGCVRWSFVVTEEIYSFFGSPRPSLEDIVPYPYKFTAEEEAIIASSRSKQPVENMRIVNVIRKLELFTPLTFFYEEELVGEDKVGYRYLVAGDVTPEVTALFADEGFMFDFYYHFSELRLFSSNIVEKTRLKLVFGDIFFHLTVQQYQQLQGELHNISPHIILNPKLYPEWSSG